MQRPFRCSWSLSLTRTSERRRTDQPRPALSSSCPSGASHGSPSSQEHATLLARFPPGQNLFTAPPLGMAAERRYLGPTRWPVLVFLSECNSVQHSLEELRGKLTKLLQPLAAVEILPGHAPLPSTNRQEPAAAGAPPCEGLRILDLCGGIATGLAGALEARHKVAAYWLVEKER